MLALVASIHVFFGCYEPGGAKKVVDGRHKADHDGSVLGEYFEKRRLTPP